MNTKKPRTALFDKPVPADDVVVRCVKLSDALMARASLLFESYGITVLQYNVLRILYVRDPDGEGMPIGAIGSRLMVKSIDVSRLVDRLERNGLVERFRLTEDRRVVRVRLTRDGVDRVEKVHPPLVQHNIDLLAAIPKSDLKQLATLLERTLAAVQAASPDSSTTRKE
jgi:DNA-binding MarR family transcriptional regulator